MLARKRTFFLTNAGANRVIIPLLNNSAGVRLGRRLAVVEYVGRRSGQRHQLVAQYVRHGETVRIDVGMAEHKTWWRNFQEPHQMRVRLAGAEHHATAHVVRDGGHVSVIADLEPPDVRRQPGGS